MSTLTTIPATINGAILANIDVLHFRLTQARFRAADALAAMRNDKRNLAIGILMDLEQLLPEIDALYRTVRLLHRSRDLALTTDEEVCP
jgi:hypothetical protein